MSRLWVRNLIGITVVGAAIAVLAVFELYPHVTTYRKTIEPEHTAAAGASVTISGRTWRLGSVHRVATLPKERFGRSIPKGASLVSVTIERSGHPLSVLCVGVLTDGHRRWRDQSGSVGSFPVSPGATEFCSKPGPLQFNFLLPSDTKPTAIDVTDGRGILLRIML